MRTLEEKYPMEISGSEKIRYALDGDYIQFHLGKCLLRYKKVELTKLQNVQKDERENAIHRLERSKAKRTILRDILVVADSGMFEIPCEGNTVQAETIPLITAKKVPTTMKLSEIRKRMEKEGLKY